jgi:hypothetical protein
MSDALVFVKNGRVRVRPARMKPTGASRWEWTLRLGQPEVRCTLAATRPLARLTCSDGARREEFSLRAAGPRRSQELARYVSSRRPGSVCAVAEACCPPAFALLGGACDLDEELGRPRDPEKCEGFLAGIRSLVEARKRRLPDACDRAP